MTEDRLALFDLIDQSADSDLVRDMLAWTCHAFVPTLSFI
jgi:hypothetical protein